MDNSTNPPAHVILGTGQLGLAVMDELVAQGKPVRMVNRRGSVGETLPPGVQVVAADLTDPANVARVTQEAEVVFHTVQPPYTRWPELFPPLTAAILKGVTATGAKLVFGDNLYLYGPTGGAPIHEGLPYAATGHKGATRAQMASSLLEAHKAGNVRVTIGRGSDFYGPRCTDSAYGEVVFGAAVAGKTMNLLGNIDQPHTVTYIKDFAKGLVILGERPEADGQAWHIPNAPTISSREFAQKVADAAGVPLKVQSAGPLLITLLGLFNPMLREFKEMMYEFQEPYIVNADRFVETFGDIATPLATGIDATLAWFRARG
jgi:nucleoside-diphosphate-sugar epimerase